MAAQTVDSIPLQDVPIGAPVALSSGATTLFVNVGVVNGASLLLRETTLATQRSMGRSTAGYYDYDTSTIDKYLMGDSFYGTLSEAVRNKMVDSSITYSASDGTNIITKTIQRKIFVPTYEQTASIDGVAGPVLSALMVYKETETLNTARKAVRNGTTTAAAWWLMDAYSTSKYYTVASSGSITTASYSAGGYYPRAIYSMDKTIPAVLDDGIYVCQF